jgi:pimeloyl-ACP methyl ester carboxylesterase
VVAQLEIPHSKYADVEGPVHFLEWDGPRDRTFVLVHGLGGMHANWLAVAPELARRGRVVVPDLPGFGLSPLVGRSASLSAMRRWLGAFVRSVADGPVIVAGNSMGGGLAMLLAAYEPDIVEGLVLTGSVFPFARGGLPSPAVVGGFALYRVPGLGRWAVEQRIRRLDPERVVKLGLRFVAVHPQRIPPEIVDEHVRVVRARQKDPDAAAAFLEATLSLLRLGARPNAARRIMDAVACPVLVVHGRRDRFVPPAFAEAALREHPAWSYRFLPDVGHVPNLEAPAPWLAAVDEWLETDVAALGQVRPDTRSSRSRLRC